MTFKKRSTKFFDIIGCFNKEMTISNDKSSHNGSPAYWGYSIISNFKRRMSREEGNTLYYPKTLTPSRVAASRKAVSFVANGNPKRMANSR